MKIRAIVWDKTAHAGVQSRRGPHRNHTNGYQDSRDMEYLKKHSDEVVESKIIDERDKHWSGPTDTIFNSKPTP